MIVLLLFFEVGADARASFFGALRIADAFLVPLSLEPLSFILEFFLWRNLLGLIYRLSDTTTGNDMIFFNSIKPFFESNTIEKIGDQLKNESKILNHYGIRLKNNLFDTQLAHYLINPDMRHDLSILSQTYLNHKPTEISDIVGKGKNQIDIEQLPTKNHIHT